LAFKLYGQPLC
jgi:hypothetical protein